MRRTLTHVLIWLGLGLMTASCGGNSRSAKIKLGVLPAKPIVILAPFTTSSGATVQPPWFQFQVTVTNNSDEYVTIVALNLYLTTVQNGVSSSGTVSLTPGSVSATINCLDATTAVPTYVSYGSFPPDGNTYTLGLVASNAALLETTCTGTSTNPGPSPDSGNVMLIATSLPSGGAPAGNGVVKSYFYSVQMQPQGWFGTLSDPTDTFMAFGYFTASND